MSKPTTTKWVDVVKTDEGLEFVRCRLVACDIKLRREGPRDASVRGEKCIVRSRSGSA